MRERETPARPASGGRAGRASSDGRTAADGALGHGRAAVSPSGPRSNRTRSTRGPANLRRTTRVQRTASPAITTAKSPTESAFARPHTVNTTSVHPTAAHAQATPARPRLHGPRRVQRARMRATAPTAIGSAYDAYNAS